MTSSRFETATIYQFPKRPRAAPAGHRPEPTRTAELRMPQVCDAAAGGGWYHDAAIREAEDARKT